MCRSDNHDRARGYLGAKLVAGAINETGLSADNESVTCLTAQRGHLLEPARQRRRGRRGGADRHSAPSGPSRLVKRPQ